MHILWVLYWVGFVISAIILLIVAGMKINEKNKQSLVFMYVIIAIILSFIYPITWCLVIGVGLADKFDKQKTIKE